jgi:hypothetical protein
MGYMFEPNADDLSGARGVRGKVAEFSHSVIGEHEAGKLCERALIG